MKPADAARELLKRRETRRVFGSWCIEALRPEGHLPAAHHRLLINELAAVARGETRKLMVLMPPGSAKTTYGSYLFPPWLMCRGNTKVIATSHSIDRAAYVSRQARRYVRENSLTLGFDLANEAVEQWATTNGGEYLAAGVGKGIAGFRADLGLIDDPVGNRDSADSENNQDKVWDWYWSDFFNRLRPGAAQVLIMTRWSEGDLGGRLEESEGDQWKIIRLPAMAEPNDPLGRAPGEFLWADDAYGFGAKMRDDFASYTRAGRIRDWSAMFQQRPVPDTGDYFQTSWLRPVATLPPKSSLRTFIGSDYAVTSRGGDYTVHIVVGLDADDRMYVCDLWRGQETSDVWVNAFCDLVLAWKPMGAAEETGQIRGAIGPWLDRTQRERRAYVARTAFPTKGDKAVRAQAIRGRLASHGLYIPADAPWRIAFEAELMGFPAAKHDDQVDALGLIGQLLDVMIPPAKPGPPKQPRDSYAYGGEYSDDDAEDWKSS